MSVFVPINHNYVRDVDFWPIYATIYHMHNKVFSMDIHNGELSEMKLLQ